MTYSQESEAIEDTIENHFASVSSMDEDDDGVPDDSDNCQGTDSGEEVDNSGCSTADYIEQDTDALTALYNKTGGSDWGNNDNWLEGEDGCDWYGVTCDDAQRVTKLDLSFNYLSGNLPTDLGNLTNLQELRLRNNGLTGAIPSELGSLSQLQQLHLQWNALTNSIPVELSQLASLELLYLYKNSLTGGIPSELGNLHNLFY